MVSEQPCPGCKVLIDALDRRILQMFSDRDREQETWRRALELRLNEMNSLHHQLFDQQSHFVVRGEHDILVERMTTLEKIIASERGSESGEKIGITQSWSVIIAAAVAIAWLVQVSLDFYFHMVK